MQNDNRGLYGQEESTARVDNAIAQTLDNVWMEGQDQYQGVPTEAGYVKLMGAAGAENITAERKADPNSSGMEWLVNRLEQRGALQKQADLYDEMIENGFSPAVAQRTLASARYNGYKFLTAGKGPQASETCPLIMRLRGRRPPTMYNTERDSLTNADGSSKVRSDGQPILKK